MIKPIVVLVAHLIVIILLAASLPSEGDQTLVMGLTLLVLLSMTLYVIRIVRNRK